MKSANGRRKSNASSISLLKTLATTLTTLALAGCSLGLNPSLPAIKNNIQVDHISVASVLAALKCQIARAEIHINQLQASSDYTDNLTAQAFDLQEGTGSFKGKTQIVEKNGVAFNIIIPFSGIDGTIITPSLGSARSATNVHETTIGFSIVPVVQTSEKIIAKVSWMTPKGLIYDSVICSPSIIGKNIETGTYIKDALVAAFRNIADVQYPKNNNGKLLIPPGTAHASSGLQLTGKEIQIDTNFTVVVNYEGGVSSKILFGSPRIDSIGPSTTLNSDQTGVYTLSLNFPLDTGNARTSKRLHFCIRNGDKELCVEETFSETRLKELTDELKKSVEAGAVPQTLVPLAPPSKDLEFFLKQKQGPKF